MAPRKIVVFGVTGTQGASVARALLEDGGKFEVIGVTRNPHSRHAQPMAQMGVKLVQGDLNDPRSYEAHLQGADGMFLNANFWANFRGNNSHEAKAIEIQQSVDAVDAAKRAGIKLLVYSALESFKPRHELPHFDAKAEVTAYIKKAEVTAYIKKAGVPATNLFTSYYYQNLLGAETFETREGCTILPMVLPDDAIIPAYNPDQLGLWARVAFRNPEEWAGRDMQACGDNITVASIAKTLTELTGRPWDTLHATREDFMQQQESMGMELWLNYLAFVNHEWKRDPAESRKLVPEAQDFRTWAMSSPEACQCWGIN